MQYGVWLKGEAGRWMGKDQGKSKEANKPDVRQNRKETLAEKQVQESVWQQAKEDAGEGQVIELRSNQRPDQTYNPEEIRVAC